MAWLLVVVISASIFMKCDSEVGHSHGYGVYHHHAHYAYEPIPGGNNYNTTVLEGDEAVLRCRLKDPAGRKITWLRRRDWHILSSNLQLYIQDERFRVTHLSASDEWNLRIRPVKHSDSGSYECQVTDGEQVLSTFIHLRVKRPRALIGGARQYHMVPGSTFSLNCTVIETRYPVRTVTWLKDDTPVKPSPFSVAAALAVFDAESKNGDDEGGAEGVGSEGGDDGGKGGDEGGEGAEGGEGGDGGGDGDEDAGVVEPRVTIETRRGEFSTSSVLTLSAVSAADSGRYSCSANGAATDTVKLFVDNADKTAAISRRNSTASVLSGGRGAVTWLMLLTVCLLVR